MNRAELTDEQYIYEMIRLSFKTSYFKDVIGEFHFHLEQGESPRMSAYMALAHFDLVAS